MTICTYRLPVRKVVRSRYLRVDEIFQIRLSNCSFENKIIMGPAGCYMLDSGVVFWLALLAWVFTLQINANVVKGVVLLPETYTTFPLKKRHRYRWW